MFEVLFLLEIIFALSILGGIFLDFLIEKIESLLLQGSPTLSIIDCNGGRTIYQIDVGRMSPSAALALVKEYRSRL